MLGPVRYFRTFRTLTYLGCSRQSQRRTWHTRQRQTSASTAKLSAGRTKLKLIAIDKIERMDCKHIEGILFQLTNMCTFIMFPHRHPTLTLTNVQTSFSTPHSFIGLRRVASSPGWSNFSCLTWWWWLCRSWFWLRWWWPCWWWLCCDDVHEHVGDLVA